MRYLFQIDEDDKEAAEKALHVLKSNLITTLNACQFGIILFDEGGNCLGLNQRWKDIYQLDYSQMQNYNMLEDTNLQKKPIWDAIQKSFVGHPGIVDDNYFTPEEWDKPGRGRWTRGHALPIFENDDRRERQIAQALILQDVTDDCITRQDVKRLTKLLEEVSGRQLALMEAVAAIGRNNQIIPSARPTTMPTLLELREISLRIPRRESEIFEKLASGLSVKETAHQLGLGAKSVYTYRTRLLQRLKLSSDVELAIAWLELYNGAGSDSLT